MTSAISVPADVQKANEDAFALGGEVGVVVDGAGLPAALRAGCRHSVAWFARSIADELHARLVERTGSMTDALAAAIAAVRDMHVAVCDLAAGSPSATVAAWRITGDRLEHLVLSDASLLLVGRSGEVEGITDDRIEQVVQRTVAADVAAGTAADGVAARRRAAQRGVEAARNRPGGFWCVHHDLEAARHALVGETPLAALAGVVALSDGASRGYDLLGVLPLHELARRALEGDLAGVADAIRAAETERADGLREHGIKVHDDLTILAAHLVG